MVMSLKIMRPSGIIATPRSSMLQVELPSSGSPLRRMLPWLSGTRPMMARSSVVFPAPLGPMMVVSCPVGTEMETSHKMLIAP